MLKRSLVAYGVFSLAIGSGAAFAATPWTERMANSQNTNNVGEVEGFSPETVTDLQVVQVYETDGGVNATPIVTDGLLFIGDRSTFGVLYVFDVETGKRLASTIPTRRSTASTWRKSSQTRRFSTRSADGSTSKRSG